MLRLNTDELGIEIANIRKSLKMTQKQLSEGICTQPAISMIEKGEILPSIDTIYYLSLRLKKPFTYFLNILFTNNHSQISDLVNYFENLTARHEYQRIYDVITKEIDGTIDPWLNHFLQWQVNLSSYKLKKITYDEVINNLKELLLPKYSIILDKDFLKERICNTIAFIYATNKNYIAASVYYDKINLDLVDDTSPKMFMDIYLLRVIYNKSKTLYDMNSYKEAIDLLIKGIERSIKLENMSFLGHFNYYLAKCYENTDEKKELIDKHYKEAGFFFKLLKNDLYFQIVSNEKKELFSID